MKYSMPNENGKIKFQCGSGTAMLYWKLTPYLYVLKTCGHNLVIIEPGFDEDDVMNIRYPTEGRRVHGGKIHR